MAELDQARCGHKIHRKILTFLFLFHLCFCFLSEPLFGVKTFFPFYNWDPFHVRPDRFLDTYLLKVSRIKGKTQGNALYLPTDLFKLDSKISPFYLEEQILDALHSDDRSSDAQLKRFRSFLSLYFDSIDWEIVEVRVEPIEFLKNRAVLQEKTRLRGSIGTRAEGAYAE